MSHPNPSHDRSNEYPEDKVSHYPKKRMVSSVDATKAFNRMAKKLALKTKTEVKKYASERKAQTKKTGWEDSGTGSRYIPKAYR